MQITVPVPLFRNVMTRRASRKAEIDQNTKYSCMFQAGNEGAVPQKQSSSVCPGWLEENVFQPAWLGETVF